MNESIFKSKWKKTTTAIKALGFQKTTKK